MEKIIKRIIGWILAVGLSGGFLLVCYLASILTVVLGSIVIAIVIIGLISLISWLIIS